MDVENNNGTGQDQKRREVGSKGSFGVGLAIGAGAYVVGGMAFGLALAVAMAGGFAATAGVAAMTASGGGAMAAGFAVGGAVLAASGYGAYRGVKAGVNALRKSTKLDKLWTGVGAVAGFVATGFATHGLVASTLPEMDSDKLFQDKNEITVSQASDNTKTFQTLALDDAFTIAVNDNKGNALVADVPARPAARPALAA